MKPSTRLVLLLSALIFTATMGSPPATALSIHSSVSKNHSLSETSSAFYFWGANGHRIVGQIAENHLSKRAAKAVADLIEPEGLAQVSTWADEIRSDPKWSFAAPWHYITVEDNETYDRL
ncbi:MAG: S1/P1 nuclease, partial [bacterium]